MNDRYRPPQYPHLPNTFVDGTSNTIIFAEHYAQKCQGISFYYYVNEEPHPLSGRRRATFADAGDQRPPLGGPSSTTPTFQAAPSRSKCRQSVAQTPHASGMIVAMGDGSVRTLSPSVSP